MSTHLRRLAISMTLLAGLLAAAASSPAPAWVIQDQADFGPVALAEAGQLAGRTFTVERRELASSYQVTVNGDINHDPDGTLPAEVVVELLDDDGQLLDSQVVNAIPGTASSFNLFARDLDCSNQNCTRAFTIRFQRTDSSAGTVEASGTLTADSGGDGSETPADAELIVEPLFQDPS